MRIVDCMTKGGFAANALSYVRPHRPTQCMISMAFQCRPFCRLFGSQRVPPPQCIKYARLAYTYAQANGSDPVLRAIPKRRDSYRHRRAVAER